jgi:hypothetical protein
MITRTIVAFSLVLAPQPAPTSPAATGVTPAQARAAFEEIKKMAGVWDEQSTKGWQGTRVMQVIAGGTAVLATTKIDPHPGQDDSMATLYHMDGDRLMLTHYCVAKNQPRLVATAISSDGKTITFTFLDGTNMKSRDVGHMDGAVITIESPDRHRARWSFYKDGKESWMEEIVNIRRVAEKTDGR